MAQFADVVRALASGATYDDLNNKLHELVEAVQRTGKSGELTLTVRIKPNGDHGVMISDQIKAKVPEPPRADSFFYVTAAGNLVRNDPRQEEMKLPRVVPAEAREAAAE